MQAELRRDLTAAIKARDPVTVAALRQALGALDDAGAVALPGGRDGSAPAGAGTQSAHVAGSALGVGATEVPRRALTPGEVVQVVRSQVQELASAAQEYERLGRPDEAQRLRARADVLRRYLPPAP